MAETAIATTQTEIMETDKSESQTRYAVMQAMQSLGPLKMGIMALVAFILIGFFAFISLNASGPGLAPLFNNLAMEDSAEVVTELEQRNIPYQLRANGTQILVDSNEVLRIRMLLAQEGLPGSGSIIGYEIFDQSDAMGTSNFVLNVNKVRALEGELSRTIAAFRGINSARVHLVIPKRELFTRDRNEPTASVALDLRGNKTLTKAEIQAIQHLVATAVPGLKSSKITIVDNKGRLLARGLAEGEEEDALATDAQEYQLNYENRLRKTVESLLASSVGQGKVRAEVTADIDFDRIVTQSETFDPEGQVARSVQETSESEVSSEKDGEEDVSVGNNLPDADAGAGSNTLSSRKLERSDATTNFEISKETSNHVRETGTVNRLSVAVVVDGIYTKNAETGEMSYTPRSEQELAQLEALTKSAIGFDEARGDSLTIVNMAFSDPVDIIPEEDPMQWVEAELPGIIQTLVIGAVAILAIMMIIRPLVVRAIEATRVDPELEAAERAALSAPTMLGQITDQRFEEEGGEDMINIDRVQGRVKSATFRKINDLLDQNPDEALSVMRQWMFGLDE